MKDNKKKELTAAKIFWRTFFIALIPVAIILLILASVIPKLYPLQL